jgi:serine phosphatase RsbU (regulator of sigma subunit)
VLAEAGLTELLDAALLLTTELATNGVLHAGTDLDVEVVADQRGLTVTVSDYTPGVINEPRPVRETAALDGPTERGRGLLLVNHFATAWGTNHHNGGKGVWFRLDRPGSAETSPLPGPPDAGLRALQALLEITLSGYELDASAHFAERMLATLAERIGAAGIALELDRGTGPVTFAAYGAAIPPGADVHRLPLPVSRPWSGELRLMAPATPYALPLAQLVAERLGLACENDRLREADVRRQNWLTFLAEAGELLAQSLDVDLTMALIPRLVVPRLGQWCSVHTADAWGELTRAAATHEDELALPALVESLDAKDLDAASARMREALRLGTHAPLTAPIEGIAVPLIARGQRLGVLAVGRHANHRQDADEISIIEDVARRAALAIDNARIHAERRRVAHTLQQSLLPPELPTIDGLELGAEYVPTGDDIEVGGDFYDVVPMPDGRWLLVIGDVSGKGVQAATVTGLVRDVIRVLVREGKPLPATLSTLNETLFERGGGRYCTLALAVVSPVESGLAISLYLAGHDLPVLVRADGGTTLVGLGGTALGLLEQVRSPVYEVSMSPGDALVFYTDGVTERRRSGELFGNTRLRTAVGRLAGYSADVVAARLRAETLAFSSEPPRDDIAILVLRYEPA